MTKREILIKARDEVQAVVEKLADVTTYVGNNLGKDFGLSQVHTFAKIALVDLEEEAKSFDLPK